MDKYNSKKTFSKVMNLINFEKLSTDSHKRIRLFNRHLQKVNFHNFIFLMTYAILSNIGGLRAISDHFVNHQFQHSLKLDSLSASQISRALVDLPTEVLEEIYQQLLSLAYRVDQQAGNVTIAKLIDSTSFSLPVKQYAWADFRKTRSAFKMHAKAALVKDYEVLPDGFKLTVGSESDSKHIKDLISEEDKDVLLIFDRGYLNFKLFDWFTENGYKFLSRLKKNTVTTVVEEREVHEDAQALGVQSDQIVYLGTGQNQTKSTCRVIEMIVDKKPFRLVTNDTDRSVEEISECYRSRWQIELFFRHIKHGMNTLHYYSTDEVGVENQFYLGMISYLITYIIRREVKTDASLGDTVRLIILCWYQSTQSLLEALKQRKVKKRKKNQQGQAQAPV